MRKVSSNVVPDLAILRVNLRPRDPEIEAAVAAEMVEIALEVNRTRGVTIDRHGAFGRPPKPLTPEADALFNLVKRAGADLGQSIAWQPTGGVCDGNNIAACGVPVVLSDLPQIEERVGASGAVRLVPPLPEAVAAALLDVLDRHETMARAARAWAETHAGQAAQRGVHALTTTSSSSTSTGCTSGAGAGRRAESEIRSSTAMIIQFATSEEPP